MADNAPIIMTAVMGDGDAAWANRMRRENFPLERNFLDAHITLFHHLPSPQIGEIKSRVKAIVATYAKPAARLSEVMHLGRGVAYRIQCPGLANMRAELAEYYTGLLTPQDQARPRLHITVQNKVAPAISKLLYKELRAVFEPRPFVIKGLALYYYRGGPWEEIGSYPFRGSESAV